MRSQQHSLATFQQSSLKTKYAVIAYLVETSGFQDGGESVTRGTGHKCLEKERCESSDIQNIFINFNIIVTDTCVAVKQGQGTTLFSWQVM